MVVDATRMCALLVGLRSNVRVLKVLPLLRWLEITIETVTDTPQCPNCGTPAEQDRDEVRLVDLPAFGRATRLVWRKRRWLCPSAWCRVGSWTEQETRSPRPGRSSRRAGRWATRQVGRNGRAVTDVAAELECDWHTINAAVVAHGDALLAADVDRVGTVCALSLDETLFKRDGPKRRQCWSTQLVDARSGQLLDVVEGRTADAPARWLAAREPAWRARVQWAVMDMSGPYRATFDTMLPDAVQVVDPFHLVKHANGKLDECRRRVQNETLGHRDRKNDPLYRCRRLLVCAQERIAGPGEEKLQGLLRAGDPHGDVAYDGARMKFPGSARPRSCEVPSTIRRTSTARCPPHNPKVAVQILPPPLDERPGHTAWAFDVVGGASPATSTGS